MDLIVAMALWVVLGTGGAIHFFRRAEDRDACREDSARMKRFGFEMSPERFRYHHRCSGWAGVIAAGIGSLMLAIMFVGMIVGMFLE